MDVSRLGDRYGLGLVRPAFSRVFGVPEPRRFGGPYGQHEGVSDNASGVQWNSGVDRTRGVATLGVNLEGMKYGAKNWPIATFIERELRQSLLLAVIAGLSDAEHAELWWSRDAWQGAGARPPIAEQNIGPVPPVSLSKLTPELWRPMLEEAYACLDPDRRHRGRALQWVTLPKAGRLEKEVSPHLQVKRVMWRERPGSVDETVAAMNSARERLDAVYRVVAKQTG